MEKAQDFIEAIKEGDTKLVQQMIARDPMLVNARSESGVSAVLIAVYYGEPMVANLLIDEGAEVGIFEATATGRIARVRKLLDENPSLANAYAPDGFQPLGLAAFFGHSAIAELLVARGAEVNAASKNAQQVMPLHSAVAGQHHEIAKLLLEHGAEVNAKQADDFTPLHEAAQNGQLEMVRLLLSYGADKDIRKSDGQTALAIALEKGHQQAASLLQQ